MSGNSFVNYQLSVSAEGTDNTSTTLIGNGHHYTEIGTCTSAAYACLLPDHPSIGQEYTVRNAGAWYCQLFPSIPGAGSSTIDGATSYILGNNKSSVKLICLSSTYTAGSGGNPAVVWHVAKRSGKAKITVASAVTLPASIEFKSQVNLSQASAYTLTLPDPTGVEGMELDVVLEVAGSNAVVITGGATLMNAIVIHNNATNNMAAQQGYDQINFVSGTSVVGDRASLISDGVRWSCLAYSGADGGITVST